MNNRDDNDPEKKKSNTDKRHEPKDARHEDRLARGDIGMPGVGGNKFSTQSRSLGREDHQRKQDKSQQQRGNQRSDRDFSKENQLGKEMHQDRQADRQNALSKEFDAAKARESRDHFTPAPEGRGPNKPDDRQR